MFDAVVYIGHGSRRQEGNEQFIHFIQSVIKNVEVQKQEYAFLELVEPTIQQTLEKVILEGAQKILVVPVLLFAAGHFKRDIPDELNLILDRFPQVNITITEPFGVHEKMIQLVQKRVMIAKDTSHSAILLVGRGSSDTEPIEMLEQIGNAVEDRMGVPVRTAFLTAGKPKLEDMINKMSKEFQSIYVMPYLLFTGLLLEKIKRRIALENEKFHLCGNLQFDELMSEALIERIQEKVKSLNKG
ncbi:cobalamin biosynthesis protein CbiX [Bacillus sp. AFS002410]|uniref:sirohydrochlorin chelatase n=1 Tax=Bacillus sp. AFS002410 TaxID=2033481 RepID=UPI000BF02A5B|nr:sirohydrochlorin chelatase [Bacillus sp. AFS002410]PEJ59017.1 cobalamin biosynthesis protein CbiX [Bacillus sp. AFS002410]